MITVSGILVNPFNEPMQTSIRVTAVNSNISILSAEAIEKTAANGSYSFNLVEGDFRIDLFVDDEYSKGEYITVDNVTPTPIDLGTLLENHVTII